MIPLVKKIQPNNIITKINFCFVFILDTVTAYFKLSRIKIMKPVYLRGICSPVSYFTFLESWVLRKPKITKIQASISVFVL